MLTLFHHIELTDSLNDDNGKIATNQVQVAFDEQVMAAML
jgi:hypothetical protein